MSLGWLARVTPEGLRARGCSFVSYTVPLISVQKVPIERVNLKDCFAVRSDAIIGQVLLRIAMTVAALRDRMPLH